MRLPFIPKKWVTEVKAICPETEEVKTYGGPNVPGLTLKHAEQYCQDNGLGYCRVVGELFAEIPCKADLSPDWDNMTDHGFAQLN